MNRAAFGSLRLSWLAAAALALTLTSGCGAKEDDPFAGSAGGSGGGAAAGTGGGSGGPSGAAGAPAGMAGAGGVPAAPGGAGGGSGTAGSAGTGGSPPMSAPDGGAPPSSSRPRPARLVVLGDSIAACSNVGNENGADCSLKKLADHLKSTHAPMLVYENEAVGAAVTNDVPAAQMGRVMGGPGHVLVLVYVGGNDLAKYMFTADAAAEQGFMTDLPKVLAAWNQIFAFFADRTRFPDGYTLIMNNQYNPFDDCTAAPYFLSAKKIELLGVFNMELARVAREKGAILTDQYKPYLGHGHHYNVRTCPNFMQGATPFMADLIHPNPAGHENLFQQWKAVVDRLYQ